MKILYFLIFLLIFQAGKRLFFWILLLYLRIYRVYLTLLIIVWYNGCAQNILPMQQRTFQTGMTLF